MTTGVQPRRLPLFLQTMYADLQAQLQEDANLELGGTPALRERYGQKIWYSVQRRADRSVDRYLDPDTKEMRARAEQVKEVQGDPRDHENTATV